VKLFFHFCPSGFSNCFLLGSDSPNETSQREAILVDPGNMDSGVLRLIEDNDYSLRGVLITHDHAHHVRGLKTIMKIYDTEIFAINPVIMEYRTTLVKDGDIINIGPFKTEVISIPGHSADSAIFKIERFLFTGDALTAGLVGNTASSYASATQASALQKKLFSLPGDYTVLPGHGPPTSLEAERRFNHGMISSQPRLNRRPVFRFDF